MRQLQTAGKVREGAVGNVARDSQSQTENEPKTLVEGLSLSGQCVVNQRNDPWLVLNFNLISSRSKHAFPKTLYVCV